MCDHTSPNGCGEPGSVNGDIEGEDTLESILVGDTEGVFGRDPTSRNLVCDSSISGCGQDGEVVFDTLEDMFEAAV